MMTSQSTHPISIVSKTAQTLSQTMGVLETFDIVVNANKETCQPGDLLDGYVLVKLNEAIHITGISIRFRGVSNVSFESLDYYSGELRMYASSEQYFLEAYNLVSSDAPDGRVLDAGTHTFQFKYRLLNKLPSTFEGDHGHVRYSIKCTVHRLHSMDHHAKAAFHVACPLDLSSVPNAEVPVLSTDLVPESLCCYCDRGAILAEMRLDRRGYVPGQAILVYAKVCNSTQYLVTCQVQLCQTVLYHSPGKNKECHQVINSIRHELLDVDDIDVWDGDKLCVPPVPPTNLTGCNIIDIHYSVLLKATADCHTKLEVCIPIEVTIGTIPLKTIVKAHSDDISPVTTQPNVVSLSTFKSNMATLIAGTPWSPRTSLQHDELVTFGPITPRHSPSLWAPPYTPMYAHYDQHSDSVRNVCDT